MFMFPHARCLRGLLLFAVTLGILHSFSLCLAQELSGEQTSVAPKSSDPIGTFATQIEMREGENVHDGDIVSYDPSSGKFELSKIPHDPYIHGVIVFNPVMYSHNTDDGTNTYPVVRFGEASVNVSTLNGEIRAGDLVTSSRVVGLGQRFDGGQAGHILGVALSDTVYEPDGVDIDGEIVRVGRVTVALRVGIQDVSSIIGENSKDGSENEPVAPGEVRTGEEVAPMELENTQESLLLIRYLLGAFVMVTFFVAALRHFGGYYKEGITAVGRNPLAHQQIRSLVVWNTFMIVLIAGSGFIIGMMIMFI